MELKLFYRTQRDLAVDLNKIIDSYWREEIKENELIDGIKNLYENNREKLIKDNQFTKVVQQQCGKRRLAVVGKVLDIK
ncbi:MULTISPECIES: TIGR04540 family protein [Bacillus]|uniref:TIGR04540 family protein n=1 Tax=Bacillus TaxID=1386 RepID=UPI0023F03FAF|nr:MULTISPECIES: TIGR04540 family protein [Bacillus]MEC5222606.1 TIGR04540 family protein [Bacillus atrophaeus]MED4579918.1 TIGR04540 family protein [Bacillus atrophaeus]MED4848527.1 TIGR04540 family protein [Bacillus atrophaeus]